MSKYFRRVIIIPWDKVSPFKFAVQIDKYTFLCQDMMEAGAILIGYPENKEHAQMKDGEILGFVHTDIVDKIVELSKELDEAYTPTKDRLTFIPEMWSDRLLKEFSDKSYWGDVLDSGKIGRLDGMKVYTSEDS